MNIIAKILLILGIFGASFSSAFAEIKYTYYYGQGCQYCANVDRYFKQVDTSTINLVKKEVYYDKDNAAAMSADSISLGIEGGAGVPFLIIDDSDKSGTGETRDYLIGDAPIIDYFTPILGEPIPVDNTKRNAVILTILGVLAVIIPLVLIKGGSKK